MKSRIWFCACPCGCLWSLSTLCTYWNHRNGLCLQTEHDVLGKAQNQHFSEKSVYWNWALPWLTILIMLFSELVWEDLGMTFKPEGETRVKSVQWWAFLGCGRSWFRGQLHFLHICSNHQMIRLLGETAKKSWIFYSTEQEWSLNLV